MNAQTIQQLKGGVGNQPDSLWHFISQLPYSMEAQIFYGVLLFGIFGLLGSYIVKWSSKQVDGSIIDYFFRTRSRATVATLCTYVGLMAAGISTGVFFTDVKIADGSTVTMFVGWYNVLWASLTTAFGADMGINKGKQREWTPEERAAFREKQGGST